MILLDTNVLVYAMGAEHSLRRPCRRVMTAHAEGSIQCGTTADVIQEFAHVYARRRTRSEAVWLARFYRSSLSLAITARSELSLGLALFEQYPGLNSFDAVLAAVALSRDVEALVSADRAFDAVPDLVWIDPAGPELDRLLDR